MRQRAKRGPRGRAVLLTALAVFVVGQLTASVLLDYRWPQLRFPAYHAQLARLDALRPAPNVVLLGSSRSACALDETIVNAVARAETGDARVQCFNASVPA